MRRAIRIEVAPSHPNEPFERMVRRFTKKVKKEKIVETFLERRYYDKPSVKRKKAQKRRKKVLDKLQKKQDPR